MLTRFTFFVLHSGVWPDVLKAGNGGFHCSERHALRRLPAPRHAGRSHGREQACSIGNKCDIDESDILEYMINDKDTEVIACYLESLVDGRRFINLARKQKNL